jgi:NAD+ synthase
MNLKDRIIDWLRNYSINNNDLCFIVGVSGGIDSSVVSTLCAKTGIETHVVSLPILQNQEQLKLAQKHIDWLKFNYKNVVNHEEDLTDVFLKFKEKLSFYDNNLAWANMKSRMRMVALYQLSTFYKGLVVGTGNKIEDFGVGFFTKYGDGGVDISPIADLTKTDVRNLAKELGVIDDIILSKPTDGLWEDDRTDEDQLGASYEELEWAMNIIDKLRLSKKLKNDLSDRDYEVLKIYEKFNSKNKHKMIKIPIFKK